MKLERRSLAMLYAVVAGLLSVGALAHVVAGIQTMRQSVTVSSNERQMYAEVQQLPRSPLLSLEHSMAKVATLAALEIGQVKIAFRDTEQDDAGSRGGAGQAPKDADEQEDLWYMDRIGKYRFAVIRMQGDIYQQAYVLEFMIDNFSRFLLIESIDSDANQMSVTAKVYGAEAPLPERDALG